MPSQPEPTRAVELAPGVSVAASSLRYSFTRSSGPGGQAVNKLSTRAQLRVPLEALVGLPEAARQRLRHLAGRRLTAAEELLIAASTHRSQLENKRACLERLRALVAASLRVPTPRKAMRPSRAKVEKRLSEKRRQSEKKGSRRWEREE